MKTRLAAAIAILIPVLAHAAPPTTITNYLTNTVFTSGTFTNAGDTGLSVSNVYACIPISSFTNTEFTVALVTNDVRPFLAAIVEAVKDVVDAQTSTNAFTTYAITGNIKYSSDGTTRVRYRAIEEQQTISVTAGYPSQ